MCMPRVVSEMINHLLGRPMHSICCYRNMWQEADAYSDSIEFICAIQKTPMYSMYVCTHAGSLGRAFSCVCLFFHSLKGKQLELSTPNLVHI